MAKPKVVNYSDETVSMMVSRYTAATNDAEREAVVVALAAELGKVKRSIVARLSKSEVYVKPTKVSKVTGAVAAKKDVLAVDLTSAAQAAGVVLVSAEKMAKVDMAKLLEFFAGFNAANVEVEPDESETGAEGLTS